jgi:predicted dehydrogenase
MKKVNRREFIKKSAVTAGGLIIAGSTSNAFYIQKGKTSPNDQINIAVVGLHNRGKGHYGAYAKMPNVKITAVCDVDERLFPEAVNAVEKLGGYKPKTVVDIRRLLEDKDIDGISCATPDYWHALMTIWGCQAGKDVYVEKPVSFNIFEGRKMVEAAKKYNRIVAAGHNYRSGASTMAAMKFLHTGNLGEIYMAKGTCYKPRNSIGRMKDSPIPQGVHWDLHRGPAPMIPFNELRFHYNWHYFWGTSTTEMGNQGVHEMDIARWGLNKNVHPVKIHSAGGYFVWDSDAETPNTQHAIFEYADHKILQFEVRGLHTNKETGLVGNLFLGEKGWMTSEGGWQPYISETEGMSNPNYDPNFPTVKDIPGTPISKTDLTAYPRMSHFENFISAMRSRKKEDLFCDILEGHMSASLSHLANISYRTGRKLIFNPETEKFVNDAEADSYLTREYRIPFVVPKEV